MTDHRPLTSNPDLKASAAPNVQGDHTGGQTRIQESKHKIEQDRLELVRLRQILERFQAAPQNNSGIEHSHHGQAETMPITRWELSRLQQCEQDLKAVLASTSWRISAPIRMVGRMLRKISPGGLGARHGSQNFILRGLTEVTKANGRYHARGPQILFEIVPSREQIPKNWCQIAFSGFAVDADLSLNLTAQLEDGAQTSFSLPKTSGRRVSTLIHLPTSTTRLLLEVEGTPAQFAIDGFQIEGLPEAKALLRLVLRKAISFLGRPREAAQRIRTFRDIIRRQGISALRRHLRRVSNAGPPTSHRMADRSLPGQSLDSIGNETLTYEPLISVIMPVYDTNPAYLTKAIRSVQAQSYQRWELCICDDGSRRADTIESLDKLAASDPRIKLAHSATNGGISAASNAALAMAEGDFVAMLDHDDVLAPDALWEYVRRLNQRPELDVLYSDEDKIDGHDRRSSPFYKPDWSPTLFCGVMYIGHLLMVRRSLVEEIHGFDSRYDGVQDFDLMLRASERTDRIHHVRKVLYHWRMISGSIAASYSAKPGIGQKQASAVSAHLERLGVRAAAKPHPSLLHRTVIVPADRETWPLISIIIPTKDAPELIGRCLDTIFEKTSYRNFEVIVVDNGTTNSEARAAFERHPVRVVPFNEPFNFSRGINLGAAASKGDYLLLLNNDTEIVDPAWLDRLAFYLELPKVGAVGPLLLYPDGTVQHAGVALGLRGTADHVMRRVRAGEDGYAGSLSCSREVAAVTAACLMVRKSTYDKLGGLNELFGTIYQDVDFCLRLRRENLSILYVSATRLIHHESASRGGHYDHLDRALLIDAWAEMISAGDPFHDPRVPGYHQ